MTLSPDARFFLRLWTAAHRGERLAARELEADGLDGPQLAMLLLVALHEPASTTVLAAALGVPFMTASDALLRLVTEGEIEQAPNPADRRSHVFRLTAAGRARVAAVEAPLRRAAAAARTDEVADAVERLDETLGRALAE
jgi:DNA-binding MarR family transcriptional regulator